MPFRRSLNPIKSEKEEITWSDLNINAAAIQVKTIADGVNSPTTAGQVEIGDTINSIFFEVNFSAETITNPKVIHWLIQKLPSEGTGATPSIYDSANKSQILHRGMEMLPKDVSTVFKRIFVVKIPRGLRRIQDAAQIQFRYIATSTETVNVCGFAIYRHYG